MPRLAAALSLRDSGRPLHHASRISNGDSTYSCNTAQCPSISLDLRRSSSLPVCLVETDTGLIGHDGIAGITEKGVIAAAIR